MSNVRVEGHENFKTSPTHAAARSVSIAEVAEGLFSIL